MKFTYWRARLLLRLSILLDRWSWMAMNQAKRDFGQSIRPADDLFGGR